MIFLGGLGPSGFDSDWIPENERDCYLGVPLESQTTAPQNHPFTRLPLVEKPVEVANSCEQWKRARGWLGDL